MVSAAGTAGKHFEALHFALRWAMWFKQF